MERTLPREPGGLGSTATTTLALNRDDLSEGTFSLFLEGERSKWNMVLVETPPGSLDLEPSAPSSGQRRREKHHS